MYVCCYTSSTPTGGTQTRKRGGSRRGSGAVKRARYSRTGAVDDVDDCAHVVVDDHVTDAIVDGAVAPET